MALWLYLKRTLEAALHLQGKIIYLLTDIFLFYSHGIPECQSKFSILSVS